MNEDIDTANSTSLIKWYLNPEEGMSLLERLIWYHHAFWVLGWATLLQLGVYAGIAIWSYELIDWSGIPYPGITWFAAMVVAAIVLYSVYRKNERRDKERTKEFRKYWEYVHQKGNKLIYTNKELAKEGWSTIGGRITKYAELASFQSGIKHQKWSSLIEAKEEILKAYGKENAEGVYRGLLVYLRFGHQVYDNEIPAKQS